MINYWQAIKTIIQPSPTNNMQLNEQIQQVNKTFDQDLNSAVQNNDLDTLYLKYFSKTNGITTQLLKSLKDLPIEQKKEFGPILNNLQNSQKQKIEQAKTQINNNNNQSDFDLTAPVGYKKAGMLHPTTQVINQINEFFRYYGFSIMEGPEIETAEYNFRKLNLPEGHPATDLQDSLFIQEPDLLLRTHTSSIEARVLTQYDPPIRAAFPGRCFRNETTNLTNSAFFYQYQGVVVDKNITIQNLFDTLQNFHEFLFGTDVVLRFRYKYYPEVSPGVGVDMQCRFCKGEGCTVCKHRGYIEVLGSGMIHYNTLKMCDIDPEIYTGFAFGMGLDRLVMQKAEIHDIRKLYEGGIVYE